MIRKELGLGLEMRILVARYGVRFGVRFYQRALDLMWNSIATCAAAVCSLTTASAFLLQAVLLEMTGRTNNDIF